MVRMYFMVLSNGCAVMMTLTPPGYQLNCWLLSGDLKAIILSIHLKSICINSLYCLYGFIKYTCVLQM